MLDEQDNVPTTTDFAQPSESISIQDLEDLTKALSQNGQAGLPAQQIFKHIDNTFNTSLENLSESLKLLDKVLQFLNQPTNKEILVKDNKFKNVYHKL